MKLLFVTDLSNFVNDKETRLYERRKNCLLVLPGLLPRNGALTIQLSLKLSQSNKKSFPWKRWKSTTGL